MSILGVSLFWIVYDVMFMMLFLFFTSEINNRIVKAFFLPITKQNIGLCPNLNPVWTHIQSKSVGFFGKGGRFFFFTIVCPRILILSIFDEFQWNEWIFVKEIQLKCMQRKIPRMFFFIDTTFILQRGIILNENKLLIEIYNTKFLHRFSIKKYSGNIA